MKTTTGRRAFGCVFLDCGGPMRKISVGGKIIEFEMHRYCGPNILNRNGEPLKNQPSDFLHAASLWAQQGQKIDESGLCIWYHEPEPIVEPFVVDGNGTPVGKNRWLLGYKPAVKGS